MARHGYVRLQVQYSCTEKWSMARTDRSPRDSRCDVSMGGGRRGDSRAGQGFSGAPRTVARSTDRTMVRCMEREGPEHDTVLFVDESTRMEKRLCECCVLAPSECSI
jgi:hypothetical protein